MKSGTKTREIVLECCWTLFLKLDKLVFDRVASSSKSQTRSELVSTLPSVSNALLFRLFASALVTALLFVGGKFKHEIGPHVVLRL
jgi:hypothetical protein